MPDDGKLGSSDDRVTAEPAGHRLRTIALFAFFFLVIAAFWVQKPIRTSRFLTEVGPEYIPWVKLGTATLILPVVMLYSILAARYRRQRMVYICTGFFIGCSVLFWWLLSTDPPAWAAYSYFFYVDLFNSVMVALFWSYANDITTPEEARRSYGFIGAGGILGGAVGSAVTGWGVEHLGTANLLLVCALILAAIAAIAAFLARSTRSTGRDDEEPSAVLKNAIAGARLTLSSRYLACIGMLVVLYEIVSNIVDYQFNVAIATRFAEEEVMVSFLGRFNSAAIIASMAIQFVMTTWILRKWGPRVGLLILPIALAVGSVSYAVVPVFGVIAALFFSDATLSYSVNQTTKEVLYTPTDSATKYQAKAFIDMFLMRFAKGLSSLVILAWVAWVAPSGWTINQLGLLSVMVIGLWLAVARAAARHFHQKTNHTAGENDHPLPLQIQPVGIVR